MNIKEQNKDSGELTSENFADVPSERTLKQSFSNLELAHHYTFLKIECKSHNFEVRKPKIND
jgi:hypothetical protein